MSSILVVVDPPEVERVARWLAELAVEVRLGDGSDETLAAFRDRPADAVVLAAGIREGDALAFAHALRVEGGQAAPIVLIGDDAGPVRTALDAIDFRADAFLRRPLAKAALLFAVRNALKNGRGGVVSAVLDARPRLVMPVDIQPVPPAPVETLPGAARHALAVRLDEATSEAVDAFLHDVIELTLSSELAGGGGEPSGGGGEPAWREATHVLPDSSPPAGTYVSELRRHMAEVEERLFGERQESAVEEPEAVDIDLDAIGVTPPPEEEPPPPRPSAVQTGELADDDAAQILGQLHRERFTGQVAFVAPGMEKTIYLEEGRPVFAASSREQDRMGELLYREGKITAERLGEARQRVAQTGRRMGEILVELGCLKRRELLPAVRRHVEDIVYSLFSWCEGRFTVSSEEGAMEEKIRLHAHPAAVVMEGIRRKMDLDRLRMRLGPRETVLAPTKMEEVLDGLAEADLSLEERRIVELFDGRRSLAEVAAGARREGLGEEVAYQLGYGLLALGLVRPQGQGNVDTEGREMGVQSMTGAGDVAIDRERVLAKHAHVKEADYFTLLGVRRDATAFEIKRAYEAARRDYAPDSLPVEVARELAAELGEIALTLDEAQKILRSDRMRASYLAHLED